MSARAARHSRRDADRSIVRFLVAFALGWLAGLALVALVPAIETWAVRQTLASLGWTLKLVPIPSAIAGDLVTLGKVSFHIVPDCTPLMPVLVLVAAMLAFPASWRWKVLGIVAGIGVLWLYNLGRVLALFAVMTRWPRAFDFVHVYLWQTVTLVVVFGLFVGWVRGIGSRARPA